VLLPHHFVKTNGTVFTGTDNKVGHGVKISNTPLLEG